MSGFFGNGIGQGQPGFLTLGRGLQFFQPQNTKKITIPFYTTQAATDVRIVVNGTPDILWTWADGTTSTTANPGPKNMSATDGQCSLYVSDKLAIASFITNLWKASCNFSLDLSVLLPCKNITVLSLHSTSCTGDISNLSAMTGMQQLYLNITACTGDISNLSAMIGMQYLYMPDTACTGDISNLSAMTGLKRLHLSDTSYTGDISNLSAMTGMQQLYLYSTSCSGNISNLSAMTGMQYLHLSDTSCTGNISNLSAMIGMKRLYLYNADISLIDMSSMVAQAYSIRSSLGANSCAILIQDCNGISAGAIAMIEGTGVYLNDGLKQAGCTVTY